MIDTIKNKIDKQLVVFIEQIKKDYKLDEVSPKLYAAIKEFCLRDGKRIRPLLMILCYQGYSQSSKKLSSSIYNASTCVELLHNFMLIHDDIIDKSDLRRGKPTMHKLLGKIVKTNNPDSLGYDLAIIAGDIVYALAIDSFLSIKEDLGRKQKALKYFVQTATFTAMGEFIDTVYGLQNINTITEKDVLLNYTLKTARYTFDCPMVIGAILAGADDKEIKKLSQIGLHIGQAFQIQDDIIGIFDSEKNIGKSILNDLAESKKTILVCHAVKSLNTTDKRKFLFHFTKQTKTIEDLKVVRELFIKSESLLYSLNEIKWRVAKSKKLLKSLKMKQPQLEYITNSFNKIFKHSDRISTENNINIKI